MYNLDNYDQFVDPSEYIDEDEAICLHCNDAGCDYCDDGEDYGYYEDYVDYYHDEL